MIVALDPRLTTEGQQALDALGAGFVSLAGIGRASSVDEVRRAEGLVVVRGSEGAGPVPSSTALILARAAASRTGPWLATGLGVRAMAAAVACGSAGVVLDAHLWLVRESSVSAEERRTLARAGSVLDTVVTRHGERRLASGRPTFAPQHVAEARRWDGVPVVAAVEGLLAMLRARLAVPIAEPARLARPPADARSVGSGASARAAVEAGHRSLHARASEAGGPVGRATAVGLWEEVLAEVEGHPDVELVLEGGLGDDPFCRRFVATMGASFVAQGGRLGFVAPTPRGATVVVGATLGRPFRCAVGPASAAAARFEAREEAAGRPLETRFAAWSALQDALAPADQAGDLETPAAARVGPVRRVVGAPSRSAPLRSDEGAIAVVGLGCVLPGALDVRSFWASLLEGRDQVGVVPPERWDERLYHLAGAGAEGPIRSGSRLAGSVRGFDFDAARFRLPPRVVATMDPSQRLALAAADQAVRAAGWERGLDRTRAAVVLGNAMGGEFSKGMALRVRFREVLEAVGLDELSRGWTVRDLAELERRVELRLAPRLPPVESDSMAGLLANVVAGRVASWLDWQGGNLTVDAACAASLAAVTVAVDWLRAGRCDAVLTGGVDTDLAPETYVGFTRTEALSDTGSSPFSRRADGFVMGEGAAVLALERLADARRRGQPILAVIRGIGQSSDGRGRGITAPREEGQQLALQRAWAEARLSPADAGTIEAHGTGTRVGDRTEAAVLVRHFAHARTPTWLGSVKSSIGHLKAAAGAASLTRAVLSLATGVVPPTLHAGPVDDELGLSSSPLRLPRSPVRLERPVAAVSAFGFGGTNFHAVLTADSEPRESSMMAGWRATAAGLVVADHEGAWGPEDRAVAVGCFAAADLAGLREALAARRFVDPHDAAAAPARLVVVSARGELPDELFTRVAEWLARAPGERRLGYEAFVGHGPVRPVGLWFPGQGAPTGHPLRAIRRLPIAARRAESLLRAADAPDDAALGAAAARGEPEAVHLLTFVVGVAGAEALGVAPIEVFGHSLGALGAAVAAGAFAPDQLLPAVLARGRAMASCPPGGMAATHLPLEQARASADRLGLTVAVVNGPSRTVLSGPDEAIDRLLTEPGAGAVRLPVTRAYHSPAVASATAVFAGSLGAAGTLRSLWRSGRDGAPTDDVTSDLVAGVEAQVRFDLALRASLAAHPDALWVELGPGRSLSALAARSGADVVAFDDGRAGVTAAAALLAAGHAHLLSSIPATFVEVALPSAAGVSARRPAPTPEAPPLPIAATDDARSEVVRVIGEVTGYPPESLADDAQLESDLGIDSIRKMQILAALERRFDFATPESELVKLADADLAFLVAHVQRFAGTLRAPEVAARPSLVVFERRVAPERTPERAAEAAWARCVAREQGDPVSAPATLTIAPDRAAPLPDRPVVLCTGGLRGILQPCLVALAPRRPRIVLLHRPGSSVAGGAERLRELGCEVLLVPGDATLPAAAVQAALAAFGRLDLVVHTAGVLRDGLSVSASAEDREVVRRPKFDAARALVAATADLDMCAFVTFSSIVAHVGNAGQAAYAAANAAMETVVHPGARTLHLAFTAWSELGMAADPAVADLLRRRGVTALTPEQGSAAFLAALEADLDGVVLVLPTLEPPLPSPIGPALSARGERVVFPLGLDPDAPHLTDHRIAGRPLVAAATWIGVLSTAIRRATAAEGPLVLTGFDVPAPVFVTRPRGDLRLVLSPTEEGGSARILAGDAVVCRADWCTGAAEPAVPPPEPLVDGEPAAGQYRPDGWFHGPHWQGLEQFVVVGDRATADLRVGDPERTIDAAHQLLALVAARRSGHRVLPVGATRWWLTAGGATRLTVEVRPDAGDFVADVTACDADGRVVLRGSGVRARPAGGGLDVG